MTDVFYETLQKRTVAIALVWKVFIQRSYRVGWPMLWRITTIYYTMKAYKNE